MPTNQFGFKFETLFKVRKQDRDQQQRRVAEGLRQISILHQRLLSLNQLMAEHGIRARRLAEQACLDVPEIARQRFWTAHLQRGALETELQIRTLTDKLAQDRRALLEADHHFKVVEKLRDQARSRYQSRQHRLEVREADELNLSRYLQQQGAPGDELSRC